MRVLVITIPSRRMPCVDIISGAEGPLVLRRTTEP
jgi:hypothetical protein